MNTFELYSILPTSLQNALCTMKGHLLNNQRYGGGIILTTSNL